MKPLPRERRGSGRGQGLEAHEGEGDRVGTLPSAALASHEKRAIRAQCGADSGTTGRPARHTSNNCASRPMNRNRMIGAGMALGLATLA